MKKVVVLSDTHGLLRDEVKELLKKADYIIHGGDINTQKIVDELKSYAELFIVRGNNDKEWAEYLPNSLYVTIEGVKFFVVHNKKDIPKDIEDVDVIVYGHSHKYYEKYTDGVLMLNPGSCGKRRFDQEITLCTMEIENKEYKLEKININQ